MTIMTEHHHQQQQQQCDEMMSTTTTTATTSYHQLLASPTTTSSASCPVKSSSTFDDHDQHTTEDDFSDSPTCVIEATTKQVKQTRDQQQQQNSNSKRRVKVDQNLIESLAFPESSHSNRRVVSFSSKVIKYEPSPQYSLDDMSAMWWSSNDISQCNKTERSLAKKFLKQHPTFISLFKQVFQDCSTSTSTQHNHNTHSSHHHHHQQQQQQQQQQKDLLWETDSVKSLLEKPNDIRGLECRVISMIRKYRKVHVQNVLDVVAFAKQPPKKDAADTADNDNSSNTRSSSDVEIHDALLRARSLRTSRPSRALARVLARYDTDVTASIIRQELAEEEGESQSHHDDDVDVVVDYDDDDDMSLESCEQQKEDQEEEDDVDDLYDSLKLIHQSEGKATLY
jgi:hypothetical protein